MIKKAISFTQLRRLSDICWECPRDNIEEPKCDIEDCLIWKRLPEAVKLDEWRAQNATYARREYKGDRDDTA